MFGQVVIGPPASGKTAYCAHLMNALKHMNRRAILINLDPANDLYHYSQSTEGKLIASFECFHYNHCHTILKLRLRIILFQLNLIST